MRRFMKALHVSTASLQVACQVMQGHSKLGVHSFILIRPKGKELVALIFDYGHPGYMYCATLRAVKNATRMRTT